MEFVSGDKAASMHLTPMPQLAVSARVSIAKW